MRRRFVLAIVVMGFSGLVAQILLLRELLVTFYGNELSIGIILANWLILEAFGCFVLGRAIERFRRKIELFVALQLFFCLYLPLGVYLTRILKEIIGVTTGEGLGLIPILYSSFFILLPAGISHGALFTFGAKLYSLFSQKDTDSTFAEGTLLTDSQAIGQVYIYETLGTIIGGVGLTYLLIPYFHTIQIALGVTLLNLILCELLLFSLRSFYPLQASVSRRENIQSTQTLTTKILMGIALIFLVLTSILLLGPGADKIHWHSIQGQWKKQKVVHYQNSIYGNVTVTRRNEQYTFFVDGIPIITTPTPDITFVEELVHLSLLSHPSPEEVLVISGGTGGVINEVLKHPVKRVDYVELDPLILEVVKKFSTPLTESELNDPRVRIKYTDGRLFVKTTHQRYDLVLIGLSNPSDLQVNRLFTKEFFSLVKKRLKEEGILVINLPGSLAFLGEELKNLNACILNTIKSVYPYIKIIPGDFNLFLASDSPTVTQISHLKLSQRLKTRGLQVSLITPPHIEYRLHHRWQDWFLDTIADATEKINQDFRPLGLFYSISYWNALFSPYMRRIFKRFERIELQDFLIPILLFTFIFLFFSRKIKRSYRASIPLCITTTGFAGMIFDLALIFIFQSLYGYVFYWIGLLVTALMVGMAAGGLLMTSFLARIKEDMAIFIKIELVIVVFSAILPVIFLVFQPYLDRPVIFSVLQIMFLMLSFASGFLIGAQFPLANKIYLTSELERQSPSLSQSAGLLYGADLFGGWIGGLLGGVLLLPVLGLVGACMVVVMLKISSLVIIFSTYWRCRWERLVEDR